MAEKGIVVSDASSGESVACRDAYEQDDQSNSRIVQLVDIANRHMDITYASPFRTINLGSSNYGDITNSNPTFDSLNSSITESLTVGDGNLLIVGATVKLRDDFVIVGNKYGINIFPVILDSSDAVIGVLNPKVLPIIQARENINNASGAIHKSTSSDAGHTWYEVICPTQSWNVEGAGKIKIFTRAEFGGYASYLGEAKIFADIVSAPTSGSFNLAYNQYVNLKASGDAGA